MKSIFDPLVQAEIANRIGAITPESKALWGKMTLLEMIQHCMLCDDMYSGKLKIKRAFIGRLFGRIVLKKVLQDDTPFRKHSPTSPALQTAIIDGDLESKKQEWIKGLNIYNNFNNPDFVHPFFGPLTKEQIGYLSYKHADHHLRQFGV